MLEHYLRRNNKTLYGLAKEAGVSYTTVFNIARGKSSVETCAYGIVKKLSQCLKLSCDEFEQICARPDFDRFTSEQRHLVKRQGEIEYIIEVLENKKIDKYWDLSMEREAFYMIAMVDLLSKKNNIPLCKKYNEMRKHTLKETVFPIDVILEEELGNKKIKEEALKTAEPEFLKYNIVEHLEK